MTRILRTAMLAGAAAFCVAAAGSARADVIRVAVVIADSAADFQSNAALLPAFEAMLKKGAGVKDVHVGSDAAHMAITTVSVFPDAAAVSAVTGSAAWKAEAAKLKSKTYTIGVYDMAP